MNEQKHVDIVLDLASNELDSLCELGRDDADTQEHYEELAESYGKVYDLLKAAPDLLEALRECLTEDGAVAWRSAAAAMRRLDSINAIARAAIAKARGQ